MYKTLLVILLAIFIVPLKAQEPAAATEALEPDTLLEKSKGFIILPLLYYTPDTRLGFGAMGAYYFKLADEESGESTRLSYIKGLADYTQNKQVDVWSSWSIFLKQEKYIVKGQFRYRNFPDRYYGIGNNTIEEADERYQYDLFSIRKLVLKKIGPEIFAGFDYAFNYLYNMETFGPMLNSGNVTGSRGGINSGAGLVFLIDKRDNVVNATKGYFFEASSYYYGRALGSSFSFNNYGIVFNKYKEIHKGHIIASNTILNLNTGDPPFVDLAPVGGDEILRGYARNRFRDMNFAGTQAEYRFPIYKRFGGVAFAGVGDVFNSVSDIQWDLLKYSYGTGLRFAVNRKERMNLRFDYGWGRGNQSFYLMITEAF
ncbi:MAG: BamA/TamA family outer membrane protein [Bacteroidetes bacterium]|nr:BamA/TamA family outer membrane protein [Bacteroidota bacterium]